MRNKLIKYSDANIKSAVVYPFTVSQVRTATLFTVITDECVLAERVEEQMPAVIKQFVKTLSAYSQNLVLFGGAVRDTAMGLQPKDWDFKSDMSEETFLEHFPDAVLLRRSQRTGNAVYRLVLDGVEIDVTFGKEWLIGDRLSNCCTFNRIKYDLKSRCILDPYNGLRDLANRVIRIPDDALSVAGIMRVMNNWVKYNTMIGGFVIDSGTREKILRFSCAGDAYFDSPEYSWLPFRNLFESLLVSPAKTLEAVIHLELFDKIFFPELAGSFSRSALVKELGQQLRSVTSPEAFLQAVLNTLSRKAPRAFTEASERIATRCQVPQGRLKLLSQSAKSYFEHLHTFCNSFLATHLQLSEVSGR